MFSFLKKVISVRLAESDAGPTDFDHQVMSFEERKRWRREMVFKVLRQTLLSLEIVEAMYKCKVSQIDQRGHRYIIMMDIDSTFAVGKSKSVNGFAGIEELVARSAFEKYAVVVQGIYWRTNDSANVFSNAQLGASVFTKEVARKKLHEDFADTQPFEYTPIVVEENIKGKKIPAFTPVSAEEEAEFMAALRQGLQPAPIHIGKKTYSTDLAPLISGKSAYVDEDPDF